MNKILIANRGEIAVRIIHACREMDIPAVVVYSEADRDALHVKACDEAFCIGPAAASESYLDGRKILDIAEACGVQAIHPGYGFLSENADFARACTAAGIVFIGPGADAIDAMHVQWTLLGEHHASGGGGEAFDVSALFATIETYALLRTTVVHMYQEEKATVEADG